VFVKAIDKLTGLGERIRRRSGSGVLSLAPTGEPGADTAGEGVLPVKTTVRTVFAATGAGEPPAGVSAEQTGAATAVPDVDLHEEAALWDRLRTDPNDVEAFPRLAEIVRCRAGAGHEDADQRHAAEDAVWALAEELAHNARAWYPLIEMARLSVHDDREAALRRLATAAERDPTGRALATGLAMLRETKLPDDALGIGMAHWRPREHDLEAGRHLVLAAVEARRVGDARRHLDALSIHPDAGRVAELCRELEGLIQQLEAERVAGRPLTDPAGIPVTGPLSAGIDLREVTLSEREMPEKP
jgi:hypothetical protein